MVSIMLSQLYMEFDVYYISPGMNKTEIYLTLCLDIFHIITFLINWQILEYGNSVRSKGATGVNPDSSRSHAILQLEIREANDKRLGRYYIPPSFDKQNICTIFTFQMFLPLMTLLMVMISNSS